MSNLIDQKFTVLEQIILNNKTPHSIILEVDNCEDGLLLAKKIAKLIFCSSNNDITSLNCNKCNVCSLVDSNNYPDLKILSTDGNWIKKQQLLDMKQDFINKSILNNKRIYIISEAEKLNPASSNSLLKFLEEPEDDIIAILLTTNKYLLLDTIISRCQIFNFKDSDYLINDDYREKVDIILDYFFKKKNFFIDYKYLYEDVFVDKQNSKSLLSELEKSFLSYLINEDICLNFKYKNVNLEDIILFVKIIEVEKQKLEYNINFKMWLDSFFSKIIGDVYVRNSSCNC